MPLEYKQHAPFYAASLKKKVYIYIYIYLFWAMLGLHCCTGSPLALRSGGYSLVVVHGLIAGASLLMRHRPQGVQASAKAGFSKSSRLQQKTSASVVVTPRLQSTGSVAVVHGLSCHIARELFLDQLLNPYLLHWQVEPLTTEPPGKPLYAAS